jgi:hypothetical protein
MNIDFLIDPMTAMIVASKLSFRATFSVNVFSTAHLGIVMTSCRFWPPLELSQVYTLWSFNIAMENGPFIDGLPWWFSMAMLNNQMV